MIASCGLDKASWFALALAKADSVVRGGQGIACLGLSLAKPILIASRLGGQGTLACLGLAKAKEILIASCGEDKAAWPSRYDSVVLGGQGSMACLMPSQADPASVVRGGQGTLACLGLSLAKPI